MPDVHVYVNRPSKKNVPSLDDLAETVRKLSPVSEVEVDSSGNVIGVSYDGGQAGQEEIERAVEEAGYEISRLSVRSIFQRGEG